ncbi:MAG: hypothetical protein JKY48_06865 [Flavobacteriales bacterium]|nr:hypothetical protein [Flavobacteriales bacterium]
MKNRLLLIFTMALLLSSCSLVKNQKLVNFSRVKYNSHLKLGKQLSKELPKTVESFAKEESKIGTTEKEVLDLYTAVIRKKTRENLKATQDPIKEVRTLQVEKLLKEIKELEIEPQRKIKLLKKIRMSHRDEWWNDDIEDWPWLEITLAVIAVLLIGIIIALLASLLGGIISSLIGLILLIALAYILYTLWIQ